MLAGTVLFGTVLFGTFLSSCLWAEEALLQTGLAFLHLPKCGGTSLWHRIHVQATESGLLPYVYGPQHQTQWARLTQEERIETNVFGCDHTDYHSLLVEWPGHDDATFVTMFRDPRERLASHYFYVLARTNHRTYPFVANRTFAEFVRDVTPGYYFQFFIHPANFKYLEGEGSELRPCCFNRTDLSEIKALLRDKFEVVGILEELKKTIEVLNCKVAWMKNTESMVPLMQTIHDMPPYEEEDMVRATALDQELYDYARDLLNKEYSECGLQ